MKRLFDLIFATIVLFIVGIPMLLIAVAIFSTSKGPVLHWSDRVGRGNKIFKMPKFRSMRLDTPVIATHLMKNSAVYLTPIGRVLRRFSFDELPQLYSIFKGHMSFVGPRPALFNQDDLIALRVKIGIEKLLPGLTGWAQVNGRDELGISEKVALDRQYLENQSFWFDLKILFLTVIKAFKSDGVSH